MKKNKKKFIIGGFILIILAIIVIVGVNILFDENNLTVAEKSWINSQSGTIQNINVANDINVFGKDGSGVFFDFTSDFGKYHNLTVNTISYDIKENKNGIAFKVSYVLGNDDLLLFRDHFVLVGKKSEIIRSISDMSGKKIGVKSGNLSFISNYLSTVNNISFVQYEEEEDLLKALLEEEDINYILVPENEYMHHILNLNYYINYHLGDIPIYYSLQLSEASNDEAKLSSILKKYYNKWIKVDFDKSYNKHNLNLFIDSLKIVQKDQDTLTSRVYNYGFIDNSPYEVIMGGTYGGIVSSYLKRFSDFSNVEFKFIKYKKSANLYNAINKTNIDMYFNTSEVNDEYRIVPTLLNINFSVIAKKSNYITVNSLKTLTGETIYVLEGSVLATYLKTIDYLDIHTYKNVSSIKKIKDKDAVIVIDTNIYNYYNKTTLKDYTERYKETLNKTYNFKVNVNDTFFRLFTKYTNSLDPSEMTNVGINNHTLTVRKGTIIGKISSYALYVIGILVVIGFFVYRSSKRITLATKIKKEDKMRFIDQLTSLKNRNYLSENVENWNNNTIYPQATIVMDLNNVQEINDTLGYDQGDAQIKAAANILIKTQLDNSDIIRTDGNEFLIYLVGYNEKQIIAYMRKLYKQLKELPHEFGAAFGYSMIEDEVKTLEDAINEATLDMRNNKEMTRTIH